MKLDYVELERYVTAYQNGDPESAEIIIEAFKGFMLKFELLILYGQFDITDAGVRNFLGLFMSDKEKRHKIHSYRHNPSIRFEIYKVSHLVRDLFSEYNQEDLRQDMALVLLGMAKRYRAFKGPSFHSYMLKAFHFHLFLQLKTNPLRPPLPFNDEIFEGSSIDMNDIVDESTLYMRDDFDYKYHGEIDDNWVNGIGCSDAFEKLTVLERKILRWYYIEKKGDQEIADIIGTCRATVNRRRLALKRRLKEDMPRDI